VLTEADGEAVFRVKPTVKTWYRARFAGGAAYAASGPTTPAYALPRVRLSRSTSWSTLRRNKNYYAKGYIAPRHYSSSSKVRIRAYKKGKDGVYHYVKSFSATYSYRSSAATNYRAGIRFTKASSKGKWKLVAYHTEDSTNAKTYGSPDYVTVK